MRLCGGFGRALSLLGALLLASTLSACFGQGPQPKEYELGSAIPDGADDLGAMNQTGQAATVKETTSGAFAAKASALVYFQGESAALSPDAKATLRKQIRWLNQHPDYRVIVEGHADEWGTRQHNLSLGAKRAVAVKSFLARNGLRRGRIQTVSYGKERPVADCSALWCREQNRRARTVLHPSSLNL